MVTDDYFFETPEETSREDRLYVLIIYDIMDNKKRNKLAKHLQGYGFRIQKSAFEAMLFARLYTKLKKELEKFASEEDSIRMYKIIGKGQVTCYGGQIDPEMDEVLII